MRHSFSHILRVSCLEKLNLPPNNKLKTRFAPSVTGELHLGHLLHIWFVWSISEIVGARVRVRLEDHDRQRSRAHYKESILEDLKWLGLLDHPTTLDEIWTQSERDSIYATKIDFLQHSNASYVCACSRKEISKRLDGASEDWENYDNLCRDSSSRVKTGSNCFRPKLVTLARNLFEKRLYSVNVAGDILPDQLANQPRYGDPSLVDRFGQYTYFHCCMVDDALDGINLVIRGNDLWKQTYKQACYRSMVGQPFEMPLYLHHPLVKSHLSGEKLSKSDLARPLRVYREQGVEPADLMKTAFEILLKNS